MGHSGGELTGRSPADHGTTGSVVACAARLDRCLGGTAALFIPMVITFAVATDFKTGTVYPPQRRPKINVKG